MIATRASATSDERATKKGWCREDWSAANQRLAARTGGTIPSVPGSPPAADRAVKGGLVAPCSVPLSPRRSVAPDPLTALRHRSGVKRTPVRQNDPRIRQESPNSARTAGVRHLYRAATDQRQVERSVPSTARSRRSPALQPCGVVRRVGRITPHSLHPALTRPPAVWGCATCGSDNPTQLAPGAQPALQPCGVVRRVGRITPHSLQPARNPRRAVSTSVSSG
jgi:hypothetical protein